MSIRIFEGTNHANLYARFRPIVPDQVIEQVINFLAEKVDPKDWNLSVDVGCGSGQGTKKLSRHFRNCHGFDVSPAQIRAANESKHSNNVRYDVSPAEILPKIEDKSVQLVTAFTAAHWFDLQEFFNESDRILVDNGVVAFSCYLLPGPDAFDPSNPSDTRLIELMDDIWFDARLAPYKNPKLSSCEQHYRDFSEKFPENYEFVHKDNIIVSSSGYAQDLVGFYRSWSLYQGLYDNDKQLAEQCLNEFKEKLKLILNTSDLETKQIVLKFNYFIAMGRKIK